MTTTDSDEIYSNPLKNSSRVKPWELARRQAVLAQQYADVFTHYQIKYQETLCDLEKNRGRTHILFESLLEKVVARSGPVGEKKILYLAGKTKSGYTLQT